MPSVSPHSLSVVSTPTSVQKWLYNQAPPPFHRANLVPQVKDTSFSVQFSSRLTTEILARSSSALTGCSLPDPEEILSDSSDNEGLLSSSEAFQEEEGLGMLRRVFLTVSFCAVPVLSPPTLAVTEKKNMGKKSPFNEQRILEQNRRMQALNNAPSDFPGFMREGYNVKLITTEQYKKTESGLIYLEIEEGHGAYPKIGQQMIFHYIGYNESGRRVDSSYQQGRPAKTRIGINAMIPGFEEGLRTMKPGGKRRLIIPPELGPPVGPSTFFSAKQFEVFDVELLDAKDCTRRTIGFYSDFVCD